jgi:hypothetical protein
MTARDHNKLLSIFFFVLAGLQLLGGGIMAVVYIFLGGAMMSTSSREDEQLMGGVFLGVGVVVGLVMVVLGGLSLLTATKILKVRPIGRTLGIVLSILVLLSFPLGTALGIYGLWFFFGDAGKNLYAGVTPGNYAPPSPPSPGTWQ